MELQVHEGLGHLTFKKTKHLYMLSLYSLQGTLSELCLVTLGQIVTQFPVLLYLNVAFFCFCSAKAELQHQVASKFKSTIIFHLKLDD